MQDIFQIEAPGVSVAGNILGPISERPGSNDIQRSVQQKLTSVAGAKIVAFQPPSLPGAFGLPVQFAIKTTEPALRLNEVSRAFLDEALKSGMFMFFDTDLKYDLPQSVIEIDRDKAAQLGLTMSQVGSALGSLLGGGYVNYFSMQTRSYKVIPQVERVSRLNPDQLLDYPIANINAHTRAFVDHRPHPHRDRARNLESFSTVELGHPIGSASLARRVAGGSIELPAQTSRPARCPRDIRSTMPARPASSSRNRPASWRRSASPSSSRFSRWRRCTRAFAIRWSF